MKKKTLKRKGWFIYCLKKIEQSIKNLHPNEPIYLFNKEIENQFISLWKFTLSHYIKTTCEKDCPCRKPDRIKPFPFYEQHYYTEIEKGFPDEILLKFFYYVCENCVEEYLTLGMVSKRFYNLSRDASLEYLFKRKPKSEN